MTLTNRTEKKFGKELINSIQTLQFCIVGCGAVGSSFAEMLVRSGAIYLSLIDGDKVEESNLNRGNFIASDIRKFKVEALSNKLKLINPEVQIKTACYHLKDIFPNFPKQAQEARDLVSNAKIVINVPDNNKARIVCVQLCDDIGGAGETIKTLSIGVGIKKDTSEYHCYWNPKAPSDSVKEGYGEYGSYMAIITEATSVGFMMLLHHLKNPESKNFTECIKTYTNYQPSHSQ